MLQVLIALATVAALGIVVSLLAVLPRKSKDGPGEPRTVKETLGAVFQPWARRVAKQRATTSTNRQTLADSLAQADIRLRTSEFRLIQVACLVVGGVIGLLRFGIGPQFLVMALLAWLAPLVFVRLRQGRRLAQLNAQLADTLSLLSSGLKAGYSFPQAIDNVAKHANPPISEEFGRVVREMTIGRTPEQALVNMGRRAPSEEVDLVISAVVISTQVGGNLARIIDSIANTIRDRVRVKGQISALTAQAKASGTIITLIPFALAAFLYLLPGDYFKPMLTNQIGLVLIGLCLVSIAIGNYFIRRIANVEV
jgi:tight adherence protein B